MIRAVCRDDEWIGRFRPKIPRLVRLGLGVLALCLLPAIAIAHQFVVTPHWTSDGDEQGAEFGYAVAALGDINADGYPDIAVGAPRYDIDAYRGGAVFLYLGRASGYPASPDWVAGGDVSGMRFGSAIAGIGDVNADGYDDFAVGAYRYFGSGPEMGRVYIFHGSAESPSDTPIVVIEGDQANARLGWSLDGAGDLNDDGYDDLVVGAPFYDGVAGINSGMVMVFPGSAEGIQTTPLWTRSGVSQAAQLGYDVAGVGDIDNDGHNDILVGAPGYTVDEAALGAAELIHGGTSGTVASMIVGPADGSAFGRSVAPGGDVNNDGFGDLLIGAPLTSAGRGGSWVYCGGPNDSFDPCWHVAGQVAGGQLGYAVDGGVDVNADGCPDLLVGAPGNTADQREEGSVFVYFGTCGGVLPWPSMRADGDKAEAAFGGSVDSLYLAPGDDSADWLVGAPLYKREDTIVGRAALYLGAPIDPAVETYLPLVMR